MHGEPFLPATAEAAMSTGGGGGGGMGRRRGQSGGMTTREARPSSQERGTRELGPSQLAGYRILRSLARDNDGEVLLGHRWKGAAADDPQTDTAHTVAIKTLPSSESGWATALSQCAALERARGDHVVELLDVDADDESIRLVFERLPRGDLAELLRIRQRIDAGEAVTVLAPIAATLLRMHAAGVAHGHLGAHSVLFRDDGSPTVIGFSRAELFEPSAPEVVLEHVEAVRRDRSALVALAVTVLGRVDGGRARAARELLADIEGCDVELALPLLAERLFEVAAALPIRFEPDAAEVDIAPSQWRAIPVGMPEGEPSTDPVGTSSRGAAAWAAALARIVPEPLLQRVLDTAERSPAAPVVRVAADSVRRRWGSWGPGRRRAVSAIAAAALTAAVVTVIVPAAPAGSRPGSASSPSQSPASPMASAPTSIDERLNSNDPVVTGDDPVAAATLLDSARNRCLSSLSLRCLELVDAPGSSALDADQAAVRVGQRGGELPDPLSGSTDQAAVVLVERLGDSALVRLGSEASDSSLLLVRGDHGWRIRDVIAEVARTPPSGDPTAPTPEPTPAAG